MKAANEAKEFLTSQNKAFYLAFIFLLSFFVLNVFGLAIGYRSGPSMMDFDEYEYWRISDGILNGSPFPFGRRTIGFPLLISAIRIIFDNFFFTEVMLSLVASLSPMLLYILTYKFSNSKAASFIAGVAYIFWPPAIFLGTSFYSEVLALPLFLTFLIILPSSSKLTRQTFIGFLLSGVILGLTAQVRPMYELFLPFIFLIGICEMGINFIALKYALTAAMTVLLGFAIVTAPWAIVASTATNQFVVLSRNGGETLAGGFNPALVQMKPIENKLERRTTWTGPGKWLPGNQTGFLSPRELTEKSYFEQDALLTKRALGWLRMHPLDGIKLALAKVGYMWGYFPWSLMSWSQILFGATPIIVLQFVCAFGAWQMRKRALAFSRLLLLPFFVVGVALISWGSWRFRQPSDAALISFAAIYLSMLAGKIKDRVKVRADLAL